MNVSTTKRTIEINLTERGYLEKATAIAVDVQHYSHRNPALAEAAKAASEAILKLVTALDAQTPANTKKSKPGQQSLPGVEGHTEPPKPDLSTAAGVAAYAQANNRYKGWSIIGTKESGYYAAGDGNVEDQKYLSPRADCCGAELTGTPNFWASLEELRDFITLHAPMGPTSDVADRVTFEDDSGEILTYSIRAAIAGSSPDWEVAEVHKEQQSKAKTPSPIPGEWRAETNITGQHFVHNGHTGDRYYLDRDHFHHREPKFFHTLKEAEEAAQKQNLDDYVDGENSAAAMEEGEEDAAEEYYATHPEEERRSDHPEDRDPANQPPDQASYEAYEQRTFPTSGTNWNASQANDSGITPEPPRYEENAAGSYADMAGDPNPAGSHRDDQEPPEVDVNAPKPPKRPRKR